jgi:hypothetical protein
MQYDRLRIFGVSPGSVRPTVPFGWLNNLWEASRRLHCIMQSVQQLYYIEQRRLVLLRFFQSEGGPHIVYRDQPSVRHSQNPYIDTNVSRFLYRSSNLNGS